MMKKITAKKVLSDDYQERLLGKFLDDTAYDTLYEDDVFLYKENGEPLACFRKGILDPKVCKESYNHLKPFAIITDNRGLAAGAVDREKIRPSHRDRNIKLEGQFRYRPFLRDGTVSPNTYANEVSSGLLGFYERVPRFPYCRQTALTKSHFEDYKEVLTFLQMVSHKFEENVPDRYKVQKGVVDMTNPDFIIPGTVFTTCTINSTFRTAVHTDKGDLHEGFSCLTVLRKGVYRGGFLVMPQYRVAFDLHTSDMLFMDAHELHGNTQIIGVSDDYDRLAVVLYYRTKMQGCGSLDEEMKRANEQAVVKIERKLEKLNDAE